MRTLDCALCGACRQRVGRACAVCGMAVGDEFTPAPPPSQEERMAQLRDACRWPEGRPMAPHARVGAETLERLGVKAA